MSASFIARPLPPITAETEGWWDETRRGRLTVQRCDACQAAQMYPRVICTTCGSFNLSLEPSSGRGIVYSHTTLEKSVNPEFFTPPYVVALVRLDEGPMMLTNLIGVDFGAPLCGRRVTVEWELLSDGRQLPLFVLTDEEGES